MALHPNELAAGIAEYGGLYQVWYSSTGLDINGLTLHRRRADAEAVLRQFVVAAERGELSDAMQARLLRKKLLLLTDTEPLPLGDAMTLELARRISARDPAILFFTLPTVP